MHGWAVGVHGTLLITDDGGVSWQARNLATALPFLGLTAAGTRRLWAPGGDGSVLTIVVPDISAILAAEHLPEMQAALRSVDVSDSTIFQRLTDFATADADLTERSNQSQQRAAMAAGTGIGSGYPWTAKRICFMTWCSRPASSALASRFSR